MKRNEETAIKNVVRSLIKSEVPDKGELKELVDAGFKMQRLQVPPFDGVAVTRGEEKLYFAQRGGVRTATNRTGAIKKRLFKFSGDDVVAYTECNEHLVAGRWKAAEKRMADIESAMLRNIIAEGVERIAEEEHGKPLPYDDPFDEQQPEPEPKPEPEPEPEPSALTVESVRAALAEYTAIAVWQKAGKGAVIRVEGDTKPAKELLKKLGFKWSRAKHIWWAKPAA